MTAQGWDKFDWKRWIGASWFPLSVGAVAQCLADIASLDGTSIYPSELTLAHTANTTTKTVETSVAVLLSTGVIERISRGGNRNRRTGSHPSNSYELRRPTDLHLRLRMRDLTVEGAWAWQSTPLTLASDEYLALLRAAPKSTGLTEAQRMLPTGEPEVSSGSRERSGSVNPKSVPSQPELSSSEPELSSEPTRTEFGLITMDQTEDYKNRSTGARSNATTDRARKAS